MSIQVKETNPSPADLVSNPGSERNLISICLRKPDKLVDIETKQIYPEHFTVPGNKFIMIAMTYLYEKEVAPSPMAIMEVLSTDKGKEEVAKLGGLEYLMVLNESEVPIQNFDIFVDKIKQSHTRKQLLIIAEETRRFALSEQAEVLNPAELVSFVNEKITELSIKATEAEEVYKMGTDTDEVLARRAESPNTVPGLEIGWDEVDKLTNGGQPGDLIIVCAESKTGKSVTLNNWATKVSVIDKLPILYIDSEMKGREQEDRMLSNLSGVPEDEIKNGMYVMDTVHGTGADKIERVQRAKKLIQEGHFYHHYMPQFTIESVTALTRKYQMQHGVVALFFDYIKIPSNQGGFKSQQEYQALGFFTSGLKDLAGMLNIPVYSACQANRDDIGGENPDASKIGGSYRILQLASKLMFLTNKSDERIAKDGMQNGNQQLWIKYQRNGASDCPPINIFFNKPILRQEEV